MLGEVFIRACHSKVVDLAQQEYSGTLESGRVYIPVMCGAFEAELRQS